MDTLTVVALIIVAFFIFLSRSKNKTHNNGFQRISDEFTTVEEVAEALRKAGLETARLIVAVDYTRSNLTQGKKTFNNRSLHEIRPGVYNPYQSVIAILGETLSFLSDIKEVRAFGFGNSTTGATDSFHFNSGGRPCENFQELLQVYNTLTPTLTLSGPTNFAPVIDQAIAICEQTKQFHLLVIVTDGEVISERETEAAIVRASSFPLALLIVGVGDGPFGKMEHYDDHLESRKFDNLQFVNFHQLMRKCRPECEEASFALNALMELPQQFKEVRRLHLL